MVAAMLTGFIQKLFQLNAWDYLGFVGQAMFGSRFLVQWLVTERRRRSTIPDVFWYLSLCGSVIMLVYSIHLMKLVLILGFSLNNIIYLRNLYFIRLRRRSVAARSGSSGGGPRA